MSPAQIFCTYIYGVFMTVDAALVVGVALAQTALNTLNAFFDAVMNLFKYVIDATIKTILDGVRVLQKKLADLIFDPRGSKFCENLYKCNIFVQELGDTNSFVSSTLIKLGVVTQEQMAFIAGMISDYRNFKETICNYGFTFSFGMGILKKMLYTWKGILEDFLDQIEAKKDDLRRLCQSYINKLIDSGIFDLMAKLKKFFNCVLEQTGVCGDIETAKLTYANNLEKMHIVEDGCGGYKLRPEDSKAMMNACDSRLNAIGNAKGDLDKAIKALVDPADVKAASKAFDLSKAIFPGGMSWDDIKHGRFKKHEMVKYVQGKVNAFMDAFFASDPGIPENVNTSFVLNGMSINDNNGTITIDLPNGYKETIDMNDRASFRKYNTDDGRNDCIEFIQPPSPIEFYVNLDAANADIEDVLATPDGRLISARRAALEIAQDPDGALAQHCREVYNMIANGFIPADEVVDQW